MAAGAVFQDRDHVEADRAAVHAMASGVHLARAPQMALLVPVHRFLGRSGKRRAPGFDLDEDQRFTVHRDQVDLCARAAKIAFKDPVSLSLQVALGDPLAPAPQRDPVKSGKRTPSEIAEIREPLHPRAKAAGELHCSQR